MKLSILLLNYKTGNLTRECLKALYACALPFSFEVIVIDNSPQERLGELLKEQFPSVRYVPCMRNSGFAAGNNEGIRNARGEYILILNPDIIITPGSIEILLEYLDRNDDVGIAAPQLLHPNGSLQYSCHRFPKWYMPLVRRTMLERTRWGARYLVEYDMREWDHAHAKNVDWVMGACMMARASRLCEVGGFDERFFLYFEDTDICRAMGEKGYKVAYVPGAKVFHFHGRASKNVSVPLSVLSPASRAHIASWIRYFLKYRSHRPVENSHSV